ncbi:MAG: hypothetical protein ACP5HU_09245 [Phycisphaerae bacterium]
MNEAVTRERILELAELIATSGQLDTPPDTDQGVYVPTADRESQSIQQCLDEMQTHIKYLLFDLEATRRENRYLRQMLQNRPGRPGPGNPPA